jgi:hypothetical protein
MDENEVNSMLNEMQNTINLLVQRTVNLSLQVTKANATIESLQKQLSILNTKPTVTAP